MDPGQRLLFPSGDRRCPVSVFSQVLILELLLYLFSRTVNAFFEVLMFAMLARSLTSLLMLDDDNFFVGLLYSLTEPAVYPVRALCERFGWFEGAMIDIPYFISFFIISGLSVLVSGLM